MTNEIACHDCDLLLAEAPPAAGKKGYSVICPRCGASLYRVRPNSLENALALTIAALILLATGNAFPLVGLDLPGGRVETSVVGAAVALWREGMPLLALLVFVTTTMLPFIELAVILWLVVPLAGGRRPPGFGRLFRWLKRSHPWAMVEVFILGLLVALVKLSHLAQVLPGPAAGCFGLLMLLLATLTALIDTREFWRLWEMAR